MSLIQKNSRKDMEAPGKIFRKVSSGLLSNLKNVDTILARVLKSMKTPTIIP